MKKILTALMICIILNLNYQNAYAYKNNYIKQPISSLEQEELYKKSILFLIYPCISKAIDDYYGFPKQFDLFDAKILSIKKPTERFEFDITIQVITFTGAHNPPRGIETITVRTSPTGNEVTYFNHK